MADGLNKAILIGHLGTDPELRYTNSGRAILKLRMATNFSWRTKEGEEKERTDWHTVVIWGRRGEGLNRILSKGNRIGVEGRIRTQRYEDKDGNPRTKTEIEATEILLLGGPRSGGGRPPLEQPPPDGPDPYAPDLDGGGGDDIPF